MIHTKPDFFNLAIVELRNKYFQSENHRTTENQNYHKTTQIVESFNNGCLTYAEIIFRLSKSCNDSTKNIHSLIEKHIVSFGSYKYTPRTKKAKF